MSQHTIETVTFKLADGVTREAFLDAAAAVNDFLQARDGFIARRLSRGDDGLWIDHVEWRSLVEAKAAAAAIGSEPSLGPFMQAIDGASATMHHTTLEVIVG